MSFSLTSKYALRILSHMAKDDKKQYSAQDLHHEIDIPEKYLRRILTDLSKSGFIKSTFGRYGGFTFSRDISTIYLSEIIESVDGLENTEGCILGYGTCAFNLKCPMHEVWGETKSKIMNTLKSNTLKDIIEKSLQVV